MTEALGGFGCYRREGEGATEGLITFEAGLVATKDWWTTARNATLAALLDQVPRPEDAPAD